MHCYSGVIQLRNVLCNHGDNDRLRPHLLRLFVGTKRDLVVFELSQWSFSSQSGTLEPDGLVGSESPLRYKLKKNKKNSQDS